MEGRLTRVAQHMAILAAIERHADETLDGCADCAHRMHLLVNDVCRHVAALKQIAVQPSEGAIDVFLLLNVLDPVDRCRLASALAGFRRRLDDYAVFFDNHHPPPFTPTRPRTASAVTDVRRVERTIQK